MKDTLKLIKDFEVRNNISVALTIYGDGSSELREFWMDEVLKTSQTIDDLHQFLNEINYKKGKNGRCLSPVQIRNTGSV
jgi:hypothetical protein